MTHVEPRSNGGDELIVELVEFSVVLVAQANNPSILNPDFLRYNEIVSPDWQVEGSPISTPAFVQVSFKEGLTVTAELNRVVFEQTRGEWVVPEVAKRYIQQVPHVLYPAIGINPKFFLHSTDRYQPLMANMMRHQGTWMSFKEVVPAVQLRLVYSYDERKISLEVGQIEQTGDTQRLSDILFQANIHRDVDEPNVQARNKRIRSILDRWEDDLEDVRQLSKTLSGGMK